MLWPIQNAQRTARRHVAGIEVGVMRALEGADVVVVAAEHVGRPRQQLEVLGAERRRAVGGGQRLVGV